MKHPEQKSNELFLMNVSEDEFKRMDAAKWQMKSLRLGDIAYKTNSDEIVPEFKPMFGIPIKANK